MGESPWERNPELCLSHTLSYARPYKWLETPATAHKYKVQAMVVHQTGIAHNPPSHLCIHSPTHTHTHTHTHTQQQQQQQQWVIAESTLDCKYLGINSALSLLLWVTLDETFSVSELLFPVL